MKSALKVNKTNLIPKQLADKLRSKIESTPYFNRFDFENKWDDMMLDIEQHGVVYVLLHHHEPIAFVSGYIVDSLFYGEKGIYTPEFAVLLSDDINNNNYLLSYMFESFKTMGVTHHVLSNMFSDIDSVLIDYNYALVIKDGAVDVSKLKSKSKVRLVNYEDKYRDFFKSCYKEHLDYMAESPISVGEGYSDHELNYYLNHESYDKKLIQLDDKFVGFTTLSPIVKAGSSMLKTSQSIAVKGTHILNEFQNQGIGSELIHAIHNYALDSGYRYIVTDFETANYKANMFWPKHFDIVMKTYVRYLGK